MMTAMASQGVKEEEVTDSTDWLTTSLPKLAPVDAALRCHVCKDFYNTPMMTSCSHTFCSLCIRRCLNENGLCPECRAKDQEMKLRPNSAIEELVDVFVRARGGVLELARQVTDTGSPKRKREADEEAVRQSPMKRRASGRTTRSTRSTPVVIDSDAEDEYVPEKSPVDDGKVECPICSIKFLSIGAVEAHLDYCTGTHPTSRRPSSQELISGPSRHVSKPITKPVSKPDRIPTSNFSMLKDQQLRKKLADAGLNSYGSRVEMEKRWTEWALLANSNYDNEKNPKSKFELKRQMDVWEKTQNGRPSFVGPGAQVKDKNFDTDAWATNHKDSFKSLVANARKSAPRKGEPEGGKAEAEAASPSTAMGQPSPGLPPFELPQPTSPSTGFPSAGLSPAHITLDPTSQVPPMAPLSASRCFGARDLQTPALSLAPVLASQAGLEQALGLPPQQIYHYSSIYQAQEVDFRYGSSTAGEDSLPPSSHMQGRQWGNGGS